MYRESTPPRPAMRDGFTLVELLVVIGIIALLISILLPALTKAQQQAKLTMCMSNMRNLGQAVGIYQAENKGAFPSFGSGYSSQGPKVFAPTIWSSLSIPVQSNVRFCPSVSEWLPFQDLSPLNADGKPSYTTRSHVSYLYNQLLGGFDRNNGPWKQAPAAVTDADPLLPVTYRAIPAASDTLLFMDYPALVVVCTAYESTGMDRGVANTMAQCTSPNLVTNVTVGGITAQPHQVFYAVAPVHFRKPATGKGFINLTNTFAGTSPRATQGLINVCYCDGSVRTVFVRQAPIGGSNGGNVTKGDQGFVLNMSTNNGSDLPGANGIIDGTRYNPFQPW